MKIKLSYQKIRAESGLVATFIQISQGVWKGFDGQLYDLSKLLRAEYEKLGALVKKAHEQWDKPTDPALLKKWKPEVAQRELNSYMEDIMAKEFELPLQKPLVLKLTKDQSVSAFSRVLLEDFIIFKDPPPEEEEPETETPKRNRVPAR